MTLIKIIKVILLVTLVMIISSVCLRAYTINGPSMAPTYWYGDLVVANQLAYDLRLPWSDRVLTGTGEPERGDLIIYFDIAKNSIAAKRIVGVPGDVISMTNNILQINGVEISQSIIDKEAFMHLPSDNKLGQLVLTEQIDAVNYLLTYSEKIGQVVDFAPVKIAEGNFFILGDNRDHSADSRFIGTISRSQIKAKVIWGNRTIGSYVTTSR